MTLSLHHFTKKYISLYYAFRLHELLLQIALGPHAVDIKFIINEYPPISTLRWLTTAERLCGLYIRTRYPSEELKWLIKFISQCYAAAHFDVFLDPQLEDAAHHFLKFIQRSMVNVLFISVYKSRSYEWFDFSTGCNSIFRKMFEFKNWRESMFVLK